MRLNVIKERLAEQLLRARLSADILTVGGLVLSFVSAWFIVQGNFIAAGMLLLLSGLCDLMDGAVARASGKSGAFGGILDSSLDRYGDGAILAACALYYAQTTQWEFSGFALSALVGSFSISYVRARAECEIDGCRVGFWERGERLVFLALALLLDNLSSAVVVLGVGTHWTVFQRLAFAKIGTQKKSPAKLPFYLQPSSRNSAPYFLKISSLILILIFLTA